VAVFHDSIKVVRIELTAISRCIFKVHNVSQWLNLKQQKLLPLVEANRLVFFNLFTAAEPHTSVKVTQGSALQ